MTTRTTLFSGVIALGLAACHHDHATNTPVNNTYATSDVQTGTDPNATKPAPTSQAPGAINSTNNAAGNNSNNMNKSGARQTGPYNSSKNTAVPVTNGTNVNTDSDMDRTGNSGTTKQGNPGTADLPDR
jgi:hypothetical protein